MPGLLAGRASVWWIVALRVRATSAIAAALFAAVVAPSAIAGPLISQGAYRIGADALWSEGVLGQGQTVAILDEGFLGLDRSIALGELPPRERLILHSVDPLHDWGGVNKLGTPTPHGVRMAEIVHDLAPAAQLVLVRYDTPAQFAAAARWIADQGIPIVSHSNSRLTAPFDGSGTYARAVDEAAARGVLWVNSAGNYALRHWSGEANGAERAIPLETRPDDRVLLSLSWAGAAEASLRVQQLRDDGAWQDVAIGVPDGPNTLVTPVTAVANAPHRVLVHQSGGAPARLDLISQTAALGDAAVGEGSVATPGDARGALTVGAIHWATMRVAPYSSYGPTRDGRAKPELSGPTYITSNPEYPGTAGTSAATPHVAGAAALLRQRRQAAGLPAEAADLRAALVAGARRTPGEPAAPQGAGMIALDRTPPRVRLTVTTDRRPLVRVRAEDNGSLERITITLAGRTLRSVRRPVVGLRLPARSRPQRLVVEARDMAGNRQTVRRLVRPGAR